MSTLNFCLLFLGCFIFAGCQPKAFKEEPSEKLFWGDWKLADSSTIGNNDTSLTLHHNFRYEVTSYPKAALPDPGNGYQNLNGEWQIDYSLKPWQVELILPYDSKGTLFRSGFIISHDKNKIYLKNAISDDLFHYLNFEKSKDNE